MLYRRLGYREVGSTLDVWPVAGGKTYVTVCTILERTSARASRRPGHRPTTKLQHMSLSFIFAVALVTGVALLGLLVVFALVVLIARSSTARSNG